MRKYFTKQYVKEKKLRSSYFKYKNLEKNFYSSVKKIRYSYPKRLEYGINNK